ncbi:hypothetical protein ACN4EK_15285 [Pantanalinema rosaneae CENA516]|uniref:hypothetical protein n=1 Tax=Pantanalinema rosaneae TaxID=1620701 RepID=UPI003D6F1388
MEEFTYLYLALTEASEPSITNRQPNPPQPLASSRQSQQSEPLTVVDDDRDPSISLYPTIYF